jgi:hypothetical protein
MAWNIIYFLIAIAAAVVGFWNIAQRQYIFLSIACILFFLVVLFTFIAEVGIIGFVLIPGTTVGNLVLFGLVPVFIILGFFSRRPR